MVLLTAILVAVLRTISPDPVLILPKYQEWYDTQCVDEEDNGSHAMRQILKQFPKNRPSRRMVPDPELPDRKIPYRPPDGSIARSMGIARDDDDPEFIEYMRGFAPAAAMVREAVEDPCMKPAERPSFYTPSSTDFGRIKLPLLMYTKFLGGMEGRPVDAVALVLDLAALGRRFELECLPWYDEKQAKVYGSIRWKAHNATRAEDLEAIRNLLAEAGEPYPSRRPIVEFFWRRIDGIQIQGMPGEKDSLERRIDSGVRRWFLRRTARFIRKHREELLSVAERTPPEVARWMDEHPGYDSEAMIYLYRASQWAATVTAHYRATVAAVAAERHQREHSAYPETLETLVPKYLDAVPEDPISGKPLVWARTEKGYDIYSVGEDGKNNQLAGDDVLLAYTGRLAPVKRGTAQPRLRPRQRRR